MTAGEAPTGLPAGEPDERSLRAWRRLDWRFLLPRLPAGPLVHQREIPDDLAGALPLLGLEARCVEPGGWAELQDGWARLVVLHDPDAADLAEAVRVLHPSGSVYVELERRGAFGGAPRTVVGVRRALRAAGLDETRPYWHAPDHASSTRIVPLDRPAAVRSTLMRYDGMRLGHLKSLLGRGALRLGLFPLAASHTSVLAWSSAGQGTPADLVQRVLQDACGPDLERRHRLPADPAVVLLTPRFATSRHVIGLVQQEAGAETRLVVKIPRRPHDNEGVSREAAVIRDLVGRAPALQPSVPEVLALADEGHHRVLVETALDGVVLDPAQVQADPDRAVRAGVALVEGLPVTRGTDELRESWFGRVVEAPLARFDQHLATALPDGDDLVRRTRVRLAGLAGVRLPLVFEHGDLSHPNLFLHRDHGLRAIDWERSTPEGLVGLDLVFYLQYVAESRRSAYARAEQVVVLRDTFLAPEGWGRALLVAHLRSRGVDPSLAPEILLATWSRTACTLVDRLVPATSGPGAMLSPAELAVVHEDRDVALWRCVLEYTERTSGS